MSDQDIFIGVALIVGIATLCQLVAPLLRLPALILLLPAGFLAGIVFTQVDPIAILGEAFTPLVNLVVALILFHGGMELSRLSLNKADRRIVHRLVWLGAAITWLTASVAAAYLLGLPANIAVLLGAILIVSGPTVVMPLLDFVRPGARVRRLLAWEGILIDPVGALVAVIVFQGVKASDQANLDSGVVIFLTSMAIGTTMAAVGLAIIWLGMRLAGDSRVLGTQVLFATVLLMAGLADAWADDAGLVTAVVMGMVAPLIVKDKLPVIAPFFDTIVAIGIGVLFVSISALVTPASLSGLIWPCVGMVAILVLVVRPASALLLTIGTSLTMRERLFIGWMAPRGIVVAATAAGFSATLITLNIPDGDKLLPAAFLIIAGTVGVYSLTAVPVASLLGVRADRGTAANTPTPAAAPP